jgi:hypothetical protein
MASVNVETRNGKPVGWRITWDEGGRRVTLRIGRVDKRTARHLLLLVERLLEAKRLGTPLDGETTRWVNELGEKLRERLARVGLVEAQPQTTLGTFLDAWLAERRKTHKPASLVVWGQVVKNLLDFFGSDCPLASITPPRLKLFANT